MAWKSDLERFGDGRCRIAQKIAFLLHPRRLALQRHQLLVPRHAGTRNPEPGTRKDLALSTGQLAAPPAQQRRRDTDAPANLADIEPC